MFKKQINRFILFCLTVNNVLPLDKIFISVYIVYLSFIEKIKLVKLSKIVVILSVIFPVLSFAVNLINITSTSIQIFYPSMFLIAAILLVSFNIDLLVIRNIILINIITGIAGVFLYYYGIKNHFVFSLNAAKQNFSIENFGVLFSPLGFSPTAQVYGTFCILFLIISFEYKKYDVFFYITIISLLLTVNRASYIFLD